LAPAGTTKTWNDGPEAGAGEHWNAHPILHDPLPTVNGELVQFPWSWGVGPRSVCATPGVVVVAAVVEGVDVEAEVAGACVVTLEGGMVVAVPCGAGSL